MILANHPQFSCTSDMSLIIYGIIFSGPLMHTDTPSGTVLQWLSVSLFLSVSFFALLTFLYACFARLSSISGGKCA